MLASRRVEPDGGRAGAARAGAFLGLVVGVLAIRRQGLDFAMIKSALSKMVCVFRLPSQSTASGDGLQGMPRGRFPPRHGRRPGGASGG